jgi:hypothetical protein
MGNYKIKLNLDIENIMDSSDITTVSVETELNKEPDIDSLEKALLKVNYEGMRKAAADFLQNLSKKSPHPTVRKQKKN